MCMKITLSYILVYVFTFTQQHFKGAFIGFVPVALYVSTRTDHLQVLHTYKVEELVIWHTVTSIFVVTHFILFLYIFVMGQLELICEYKISKKNIKSKLNLRQTSMRFYLNTEL
jgi:hypothetical protein